MDAHNSDDDDIHEEGDQLEDSDEEEDEGDDEEDEELDEEEDEQEACESESDDDSADYYNSLDDHSIQSIAENDPGFHTFRVGLNDCKAVQLGRALVQNTELTKLTVWYREQGEFTSQGARALVEGMIGSQVKELQILGGGVEVPLEMSQLCTPSMRSLDLFFPIRDDFAVRLSESLTSCNSLGHLSIHIDQMTHHGAQVISNILRSSSITSLEFTTLKDTDTTSAIQTLYLEGVQHCQNIQSLTIRNVVGDIHALTTTLSKLQELQIHSVHLSVAEVDILTHGLRDANNLSSLSLSQCDLNDTHVRELSSVLGNHRCLKSVTLSRNQIGDAGIISFVERWSSESKIEELDLSANYISYMSAQLLIRATSIHATTLLNFDYNRAIGYVGLKLISDELPGKRIHTLMLNTVVAWIKYDDVTCVAAVRQEAQRMEAAQALLQGIRGNFHLMALWVGDARSPFNIMSEIQMYVQANKCGRGQLYEHQHTLPFGVCCHFLAKRQMTSSLMFLFLKELPSLLVGR